MIKQICRLSRLQLGNLFGLNEFKYTKDRAKRGRYIGLVMVWIMLILMVIGYVGAFSYSMIALGIGEVIPMYLYAVASLLILVFSFFKAGNTLFAMKGYEMLISLPVSRAAIISSRFICMYVTNLLAEALIMLPGMIIYGYLCKPSVGFYIIFLFGGLFLPLLPLTISSIIGAFITAVSSRSRHKSFAETMLVLVIVVATLTGSFFLSDKESQITEEMLKNMAEMMSAQIGQIYPPSIWFQDALCGDWKAFGLLILIPAVIFAVFVLILQKYFQNICAAIHAVVAKNNYKITSLQRNSRFIALWKKELKRYFSSSIYVTNTIIGYVMAVIVSAGILFMGIEELEMALGISDIEDLLLRCLPFGLSCMFAITSITACSISMEGDTFWQIQTLPVTPKEIYDSKILTNISIAAPFYLISVILLGLAVKPTGIELVWFIVIPMCYIMFLSVLGITINLSFPVLKWENEVRVVKQSASMLVTMLIGMLSSIIPLVVVVFAGEELSGWVSLLTVIILFVITGLLYRRNSRLELMKLSDK